MRHCYVRRNKTAGIYKQAVGRVNELQSFFISRQKTTLVHAINHTANFTFSIRLLGSWSRRFSSRAALTFALPKHAQSCLYHPQTSTYIHLNLPAAGHLIIRNYLSEAKQSNPQGPDIRWMINNDIWHVSSVSCQLLHWAYLFCGCRL